MRLILILSITCALSQQPVTAQEENPSAQSVIERYVQAKGGQETLAKIKNYTIKGEVISEGEVVGKFEIFQAPNLHLSINRFPNGSKRTHGTDGKIAWQIDTQGQPKILTGQEARDYMRHYSTLHEALNWRKQFETIEYVKETTLDKTPVHHLAFHTSDGRKIDRFFDVQTGLFVREEQKTSDENETFMVSEIKDYVKEKNGSMVSRKRINHFGTLEQNTLLEKYMVEYKIRSIESNTINDLKIFALPFSVAKLQQSTKPDKEK
ncbi:MAG: hypothetical protein MK108_10695 [Mariniblastus sp.]|nr:hypothetical protein [Mariniblastus sp.]